MKHSEQINIIRDFNFSGTYEQLRTNLSPEENADQNEGEGDASDADLNGTGNLL